MANWGGAGKGALTGAGMGAAVGGPWGAAIGAGVGGLAGLLSPQAGSPAFDWSGYAAMPDYQAGYDPSTMSLAPQAQSSIGGVNLDTSNLNALSARAQATGLSPEYAAAQQQQQLMSEQAKAGGRQAAASSGESARTALERTGGMSSGARLNLARGEQKNVLDMNQRSNEQLAQGSLGVQQANAAQKAAELGQAQGLSQNAAQFNLGKANDILGYQNMDVQRSIDENRQKLGYGVQVANSKNNLMLAKNQEQMDLAASKPTGLFGSLFG